MVADVRGVEPAPVVAHEVPHPRLRVGGVLEEGERAVDDRRPDLLVPTAGEVDGDDREPRHVVDAVAGLAVRDHPVRVLHDPHVVDEGEQMVGPHAHELRVEACDRPAAARSQLDGFLQHGGRRLGDRRPRQQRSDLSCLGAGSRKPLRLVDVTADGVGERLGVAERHELAGARREHVLRVPVRRRDDPAAGRDPEGERAGGDLLTPAVRRHEDVGCGEQVCDLVDCQEAVFELDVVLEPVLEHCLLERQPIPLSFAVCDVRVCPTGDHVEHIRMALDDRRQRLDHRLDPLSSGDQPERGEQEPVAAAVRRADRGAVSPGALQRIGVRALREHRRRAMGHDSNLFGAHASPASSSRLAVSVITITSSA